MRQLGFEQRLCSQAQHYLNINYLNPALSFTVCPTLEFKGALSCHTVFLCWHLSLETPQCLSVWKTPAYPSSVNSCPGFLIPLSLAWRLVLLYTLCVSVAPPLVKVMYICLLDCELPKNKNSPKPNTMSNAWQWLGTCV